MIKGIVKSNSGMRFVRSINESKFRMHEIHIHLRDELSELIKKHAFSSQAKTDDFI